MALSNGDQTEYRVTETTMKRFNNTLEGTDCGDAGLPVRCREVAKAKTVLRIVPKTTDSGSVVIQFPERRDR
jgi:hypothetical protein